MQVAGGYYHTIGLREDGTAIAWGQNEYGQCNVPAGETFVSLSCGDHHTIGLRSQQDSDGDGVPDSIDNCYLYNPDQTDCNENGIGDVCDVADQFSYLYHFRRQAVDPRSAKSILPVMGRV